MCGAFRVLIPTNRTVPPVLIYTYCSGWDSSESLDTTAQRAQWNKDVQSVDMTGQNAIGPAELITRSAGDSRRLREAKPIFPGRQFAISVITFQEWPGTGEIRRQRVGESRRLVLAKLIAR
jgi:hypothetical protein